MARPRKTGLDYFPFDIDFFSDEKVVCVAGEYGAKGEAALIRLLCAIYRNGYFVEWTEMMRFKLAATMQGVSPGLIDQIVNSAVRWGMFDKTLFSSHRILTSRGIQRRYFEAVRLRKIPGTLPFLLVEHPSKDTPQEVSNEKNIVSNEETPVSNKITPQSKVNEIKEKRKNSLTRVVKNAVHGVCHPPSLEEVEEYFKSQALTAASPAAFFDYYQSRGWKTKSTPIADWRALARLWCRREKSFSETSQPTPPRKGDSPSETELMRRAQCRRAKADAEEQLRRARDNPLGLSSAQALAEYKRKIGFDPDTPLTEALGPTPQ